MHVPEVQAYHGIQVDPLLAAQQQQEAQLMMAQAQNAQNTNWLPPIPMPITKPNKHEKAIELLKMRMGGVLKDFHPDPNEEFLICHVHKDTVFVFFVAKGVAGNLEESVNQFPSDKLIAQLRLLWS